MGKYGKGICTKAKAQAKECTMARKKKRKERRMQTSEKTVQRNDRKFRWTGLFCVCV